MFSHYITPLTGGERYAVIYRHPVSMGDEIWWVDEDKDPDDPAAGGQIFYRVPVEIPFQAGQFDFILVIVHLTWKNRERRTEEMRALSDFMREEDPEESDWIVLGDLNRYGLYKEGDKKAFDLLLEGEWQDKYRFPLLEAVTEPDDMKVFRADEDQHSTTVAKGNNLYDQFIITKGVNHEFGSESAEFGEDVGIIAFDMEEPYASIRDHNRLKCTVSDHRPIWMRLQIDKTDDD